MTSLIVAVSSLTSLAIGCVIGVLIWRFISKPYPPEYQPVADAADHLSNELNNVNKVIEKLIKKAGYRQNFKRTRVLMKTGNSSAKVHAFTKLFIDARLGLEGYRRDLENLEPCLRSIIQTRKESFNEEESKDVPAEEESREKVRVGDEDQELIELTAQDIQTTEQFAGVRMPQELVGLYNRAVTDSMASARFRERYQPLRISTTNAVERRQNPTIEEEFREATNGDFFAVEIIGQQRHAVVPRLGLTIEAVSLNAGGLARVFNITNYDPSKFYSRYQIQKPAVFARDGDNWLLDRPGELELGDPD